MSNPNIEGESKSQDKDGLGFDEFNNFNQSELDSSLISEDPADSESEISEKQVNQVILDQHNEIKQEEVNQEEEDNKNELSPNSVVNV